MDKLISDASTRHGIPENLLRAIIEVESGFKPWANRAEPHYRWLWNIRERTPYRGDPENIPAPIGRSHMTELWGQRMSWGLMQIMGAVAREYGFAGRDLTELCDPAINLQYGCHHLTQYYRRFGGEHGWEGVVRAYNTGRPDRTKRAIIYQDKIMEAGGL